MRLLRVVGSLDPAEGGLSQAIRSSAADLENLGVSTEVVSCDSPEAAWMGQDSFPVHALGPRKYGFAYTPKLGPWLEGNLSRFDAVIIDGLWLWPSTCAVRAVARERARRAAGGRRQEAGGGLSSEKSSLPESLNVQPSTLNSKQLRCFVMPHGMLDPWFQRDKSRRVKAVRNWFYWWLVERGVVNSADAMLFTCQQELELARTTFGGYRPKKEIVVGLGIEDPPAFEPKMQEAFAARCPDLNGRPYLLFMSRIHPKKNVAALLRAYARVRGEHVEKTFSHSRVRETAEGKLTRIDEDGSERLSADRTRTECLVPGTSAVASASELSHGKTLMFPDLVVAGPGWDSDYGKRIKELIREQEAEPRLGEMALRQSREQVGVITAVAMLQGDAKWGALYGCEAFVLPSHQENFGIAVVEALACGKPVLISDQVNIWREIAEDGAGLVEEDADGGVEKLLRRFLERSVTSDELRVASATPRECYLKRFAIAPAVKRLADALKG